MTVRSPRTQNARTIQTACGDFEDTGTQKVGKIVTQPKSVGQRQIPTIRNLQERPPPHRDENRDSDLDSNGQDRNAEQSVTEPEEEEELFALDCEEPPNAAYEDLRKCAP